MAPSITCFILETFAKSPLHKCITDGLTGGKMIDVLRNKQTALTAERAEFHTALTKNENKRSK